MLLKTKDHIFCHLPLIMYAPRGSRGVIPLIAFYCVLEIGTITNYGEGGYKTGVLAMLKGEQNKFWGSFYLVA